LSAPRLTTPQTGRSLPHDGPWYEPAL
jgi:hypothetical protein